ncbi:hypothetical protein BHE74_00002416 [Ensete ventricosum]|nr:hypothetical protein GW17_00004879 [Ensete ventricosum]RWW88700.1 hypothetical protein BHE74_00002416 [Ensete ventricosum]RZS06338.1 hypothetical protein BHM03_00036980 [Ensete ventricosum]
MFRLLAREKNRLRARAATARGRGRCRERRHFFLFLFFFLLFLNRSLTVDFGSTTRVVRILVTWRTGTYCPEQALDLKVHSLMMGLRSLPHVVSSLVNAPSEAFYSLRPRFLLAGL